MTADVLRGIAGLLSAAGSILLAFRVSGILSALHSVAEMHEKNIKEIGDALIDPNMPIVIGTNSTRWIEKAKATWMLLLGFLLLAAGGLCQFIAGWFLA